MLTNLLRYEFKSTGRVVLPIAAGVLVLNIFTNILSHFVQNTSDRLPLAGVAMALLALASAVSLLVVLAICFFVGRARVLDAGSARAHLAAHCC